MYPRPVTELTRRDPPAKRPDAKAPGAGPPPRGIVAYFRTRHDPLTSLVLTIPVFLLYHLGILALDLRNGVDLVSSLTFELLHQSLAAYVALTLAVAAGLVATTFAMRKRGVLKPASLAPVVVESIGWAVLMLFAVGWATSHLFAAQVGQARPLGPFEKLVMSAGAGFHEELVFRVGLFGGATWLLRRFVPVFKGVVAPLVAALATSLVFSAIHYVGPLGDSFRLVSFVSRLLAGLYLCALYRTRGFAVAVYTHALYDVMIFFFLQ